MTKTQERLAAFVFGVVFLIVMLVIAIWLPNPTQPQFEIFKVVLALAAAGVTGFIPGFLEVTVPGYVRAGGALAVFVLIYTHTPAEVVATAQPRAAVTRDLQGRVYDSSGKPLSAARVQVDDDELQARATSAADGTFTLKVKSSPDRRVLFRVTPQEGAVFTRWREIGTGSIDLTEPQKP
jgi:hypothetical protein